VRFRVKKGCIVYAYSKFHCKVWYQSTWQNIRIWLGLRQWKLIVVGMSYCSQNISCGRKTACVVPEASKVIVIHASLYPRTLGLNWYFFKCHLISLMALVNMNFYSFCYFFHFPNKLKFESADKCQNMHKTLSYLVLNHSNMKEWMWLHSLHNLGVL